MASNRGRTHIIRRSGVSYFLDTAHTSISIEAYANWFIQETEEEKSEKGGHVIKILIFHLASYRSRSGPLSVLAKIPFDVALFCPFSSNEEKRVESLFGDPTYEEQLQWSTEAFEEWKKILNRKNKKEGNLCEDPVCLIKGDHSHIQSQSSVVPSLMEALTLATSGKEKFINHDVSFNRQVYDLFPEVTAVVQSADHVQIMIVGGHKIVAHTLTILDS